jgi:hypothetical protein
MTRHHSCLVALLVAAAAAPAAAELRIVFPSDPAVLDVRRDFGAKGDGLTDDTEALQGALDAGSGNPTRAVYLPDGVYRVSSGLVVKSRLGPWLYGESRDGVVIRLDDGVGAEVTAVLRTHPHESGRTSSDWFMRNIRNLTVDAGDNPHVDGIRWYATNTGIIQNVTVRGRGRIGINSSFHSQSGPNLVQDTLVEGFETGVTCHWVYGQTLSRVTIRNCRNQAVSVSANAVAIEDLVVENTPVALVNLTPKNWKHWAGVVAIVGGRFDGGDSDQAAIINQGVLYARDVRTSGFKQALQSDAPGGEVIEADIREHASHGARKCFPDAPDGALRLPVKREPFLPWESNPDQWVCANEFGAVAGDNRDDTAALQRAIDAAAAAGKSTVYLRGVGGPDPNWYSLKGEVRVHGSVRHILGLGFGRIVTDRGRPGRFVIGDDAAPVVKFQNIDSFGGGRVILENRSTDRVLVAESCGVDILGTGRGEIFVTDCPAHVTLTQPGQRLWARHLNAEGTREGGLVQNHGGVLWVLGSKSEGPGGVRYATTRGGRTEVFGMFQYTNTSIAKTDTRPLFLVENAALSVMGLREICHTGKPYVVKARETRGDQTRVLTSQTEGGWTGWSLLRAGVARSD